MALPTQGAEPAPSNAPAGKGDSIVLEMENKAEALPAGTANWMPAKTNQTLRVKDRFRTGFKSRATLRLSNQGILRVSQLTTLEIQPPSDPTKEQSVLDLKSGTAYFFNRDAPVETQFKTPQASGAIRGTEFNIEVDETTGRTVLTMLDGAVDLSNDLGKVSLASGEQGIVDPGQAPRKTAVIEAMNNIIQWSLYYPGVLDVSELGWTAQEQEALKDSLSAYRAGDLLQALASYPTNRTAVSASEKVYAAALQLSVGQVKEAEAGLAQIGAGDARLAALAGALREVIAAVKFQEWTRSTPPETATEWMAESYYHQSRSKLPEALDAAKKAVEKSPNFGFASARVAEMEFSFGRTEAALKALDKGLELSPRNAQALSLKGFLLAAQNRIASALSYFEQAMAADGGLGNAWLGRGLCRIRLNQSAAGRQDLQVAATLEPHRAVLRSYLAKAYSNEGDLKRAEKEMDLAKHYDPNDPTAWLYSALLYQQENRVNEGVRDLEKSLELNDNRSVFRSRLLLDQDRAVRSANLAAIYRDAGMTDVSVREASRAVNSDYANYSAHLFLANSYDELRDPRQVTLRYETPWLSEFLLANLLAPVGAGTLSQSVSQQEYSKLFERDRFGVSSSTEYGSGGDWLQTGSQFGTFGSTSYSFDVNYRSQNGQRPNEDLEGLTWWSMVKQQITPQDSVFIQTVYYDFSAGDVAQYYDPAQASTTQRITEKQEPNIFAGYHHEWAPGVHTLLLAGRLNDTFTRTDPANPVRFLDKTTAGVVTRVTQRNVGLDYRSELEGYSAELQQIWQQPSHTLILGGRYQTGSSETSSLLDGRPSQVDLDTDQQRISVYGYHQWQVFEPLRLTAGVSYDRLEYPRNIDIAPIIGDETSKDQVSPKVGLLWSPTPNTHVRGFYARSLGGLFFDQSIRIEPVQIAGFTQTYRSVIPESVSGLVAGSEFDTWSAAVDHQFKTGTYVSLQGELLESSAERDFGVYDALFLRPLAASSTPETLDFKEKSLIFTFNQLLSKEWSLGLNYKLSQADLNDRFPGIPAGVAVSPANLLVGQDLSAVLNQLSLSAIYNLPCGFFSVVQSLWFHQSNRGYAQDLPGDDFWHLNLYVGYRFPKRRAEVRVGLMNLTDRDYRLNPLNLHTELPRDRTLTARLRFNF
jgi:tetratricopeptide (TPR) repeat protein